jgi:vacuolar iron transporter family protein
VLTGPGVAVFSTELDSETTHPAIQLPTPARVPVAFMSVLVALVLTGAVSAGLGGARKGRAVLRVVLGGALAMLVTYSIGQAVGTTI